MLYAPNLLQMYLILGPLRDLVKYLLVDHLN